MGNNIILETKFVADISGSFYIPSYQRGYRWSATEVVRLLDDIYQNGKKNYCLQPVVVRKKGEQYELIDGQQRLTTLYLIYTILVELLKSKESFDDGILDRIISAFLAQCEKDNLYPWNYYYVKYPVFRPGSYGKMSNDDVVNKPYMFSVMQTKTQWSQNTYMPYLKEADDDHLSRDEMGQYLVYDDVYIVCENNSYGVYRNDDDSLTDTVTISQNEAGIDTEDRIIKLKKYIANMK